MDLTPVCAPDHTNENNMKHGGTWDSNPGPMAFSTALLPTELCARVVHRITTIDNI